MAGEESSANPWVRWRAFLRDAKDRSNLSYGEIAARLGPTFNSATITNYFTGKARPPLELVSALAEAVEADPHEALVALGLLSEQYARAVLELAALRRRVVDLEATLRAAQQRSPASAIADQALDDGCAIGLWPGVEGIQWGAVSVGHRISLVATAPTASGLSSSLIQSLSSNGAVRVRKAARQADIMHLRPEGADEYELWSMPTLTAARPTPHGPRTRSPRAIVVFSLTLTASPNDVGSLLAYAFRYGYSSTREARSVLYGGGGSGRDLNRERNRAARVVFADADLRDGMVWSHFGAPVVDVETAADLEPFAITEFLRKGLSLDVCCVWLRETEGLLELHRARSETRFSMAALHEFQHRIERSLAGWPGVSFTVLVDLPKGRHPIRDRLMDRSVRTAADLVRGIESRYGLTVRPDLVMDDTAPEALRRAMAERP